MCYAFGCFFACIQSKSSEIHVISKTEKCHKPSVYAGCNDKNPKKQKVSFMDKEVLGDFEKFT